MKHENFFGIEEILGNIILNEIHTYIYIYIHTYTYTYTYTYTHIELS